MPGISRHHHRHLGNGIETFQTKDQRSYGGATDVGLPFILQEA